MTADQIDQVANEAQESVRVTIEVAGLTEEWEFPCRHSSHLADALASIDAIAVELRRRYEQAQQLERELGDAHAK